MLLRGAVLFGMHKCAESLISKNETVDTAVSGIFI